MKEALYQLRDKYNKKLVSVIVGAGFSRNACKEYPLWKDLLYDMVVELYQEEIEEAYLRYRDINPGNKVNLDAFTRMEVPKIIERVGYLKMVSEYIARKGYREAIEHYIEERIPYIDTTTQQLKFAGKNKDKAFKIVDENFSAHKKLLEGDKWERIYTTNYDRLLEYVINSKEKKYAVITRAKDLSVNTEKTSIIKLHGDLYNPKDKRVFMFDGNPHQQYIISEEDYKNYPKEHEAFTQLMRISLLQGVFCLIGFSGDDPNFVNWISWVRDVLVTDEENNSNEGDEKRAPYKIFLIGLSDKEPDDVRKIFYENHNIIYVPLLREDVKEIIDAKGISEPRDLFCKFFDYLYRGTDCGKSGNDSEETPSRKIYNELWNQVFKTKYETSLPSLKTVVTVDERKVEQLYALKPWNRVVTYTHNQLNFISEMFRKKSFTVAEAKLMLLALVDTGLTVDDSLIKTIDASEIGETERKELDRITARTKTLLYSTYDEEPTEGIETYELILRSLFSLDYKKIKELLENWDPTGTFVVKKALVLSFFDKEQARIILWDYIKQEPKEKEQFYATRLLNMLEDSFPQVHPLDRFENANVQDYYKDLTNLIKWATNQKEKIKGYGSGKNEKIYYIGGGKPSKITEATAVLNLMLEAPAFVSYRNFYTMVNPEDWYHIHKILCERYPLPVLYYGMQCTDSKVKTRIGQDFAYSDYLAENYLEDILSNLLKAYIAEETPNYLRESILIISREIFVSVMPVKWEGLFVQIWEDIVLKYRYEDVKNRRFDELDRFVEKALNSVVTLSVRQRIIQDVLAHVKEDTGFAINCLYYLHTVPSDLKGNDSVLAAIQRFVEEISTPEELNVAGNIYRLLTDEQKDTCAQKCLQLLSDNSSKITNLVYHVSEFFVKDSPEMTAVFVKSICENPLLWKNGVMGEDAYSDFTCLKLSEFTRRIYIDKTSLLFIFENLKRSAAELIKFTKRHGDAPFFSDTDGLMSEMITFLKHYEKRLCKEEGYYEVLSQISEAYHRVSGLGAIEDGLLSEFESDVKKSINYIMANKESLSRKELVQYFDIIINRVMLKNSDGLDFLTECLWYFLYKKFISLEDERHVNGILKILDRYEKNDVQECNMDLVLTARYMGKLAMYLSEKGFSSKGIDYWKRFKRTSRFYCNFD